MRSAGSSETAVGALPLSPYARCRQHSSRCVESRHETRFSCRKRQGHAWTYNGNPLVDVRTGAGHADVRLGGLWNRHVWKKDTRARAGRFIKYQNR
jgi:hypothetical protein